MDEIESLKETVIVITKLYKTEIDIIKDRLTALEREELITLEWTYKRIAHLEKTIGFLSIATSLSFLFSFLLIAHVAKYI